MIDDEGIRTLIPRVVLPSEEKEKNDAREYVRRKLGVRNELPAAPTTLISDYLPPSLSVKLPAETKNEFGYTPSEEKVIEKQMVKDTSKSKGKWAAFVARNERAEKEKKEELAAKIRDRRRAHYSKAWGVELDPKKMHNQDLKKNIRTWVKEADDEKLVNSKILKNNINNLKKEEVILDPKHPDGFRFAEDMDLYKNYGDTPVRYIQEIRYKYDGAAAPTDSVVKTFKGDDASTFPSNPDQKKALAKYQMTYNKLSPLQRKQLESSQKTKKNLS